MKKLEDIPKTDLFKAPDGYFDSFPAIINNKVSKKEFGWLPIAQFSLKYAMPVVVVAFGLFWFLNQASEPSNPDQILASISSDDLIEYIQEGDLNTDDLLENIDYTQINADSLNLSESQILLNEDDMTDILNEFETEL
jgi:hypothetical protein